MRRSTTTWLMIIIMPMSQLVKPSLLFRSTCAQLNPYGHRHHCGKQISSYIHDKSILLLGHLDACNIDRRKCILTSLNLSINQSSSQLLFKQVTSNLSMILLSYLIHLNKGLTNCWTNFFYNWVSWGRGFNSHPVNFYQSEWLWY